MPYNTLKLKLLDDRRSWLITGAAGFIGSHLVETLLGLNQSVVGLDNFSTGYQQNLDEIKNKVTPKQWSNFTFIQGDIRDAESCVKACKDIDYILHQAALGSVPRSIVDPVTTNHVNVDGFLNMLVAAKDAKVKRFVYAASSSTYGDSAELPKVESRIGRPLSPYAVTKYMNELYADVFGRNYGLQSIGLRYFNVFGARQDPNGAYAAVIPKWITAQLQNKDIILYGDGQTTRDFCHVDNAIQANLLAAAIEQEEAINQVYNVAYGEQTSLNKLFELIREELAKNNKEPMVKKPTYLSFRQGDVRHSLANIDKAKLLLGYNPVYSLAEGLEVAMPWYIMRFAS